MFHLSYVMFQQPPPLVQPLVMMTSVLQNGWSPLNAASDDGHLDVVKTLLEAGANINQANDVGTCTHTWCSLNYNCTCTTQPIVYKIKLQYCTCIEHAELWTLRKALNICMSYVSHAFSVHVYCVGAVWCVMLYPWLCIVIAWQLCCAGHWCAACPAAMVCIWLILLRIECLRKNARK